MASRLARLKARGEAGGQDSIAKLKAYDRHGEWMDDVLFGLVREDLPNQMSGMPRLLSSAVAANALAAANRTTNRKSGSQETIVQSDLKPRIGSAQSC